MGSALGAMKTAAARIGIPVEEYLVRISGNEKWCIGCKGWHDRSVFAIDRSRSDNLTAKCRAFKNSKSRGDYVPTPPRQRGRRYVDARDGDKEQARRRVNYLIEAKLLPRPNDVACVDCGHKWSEGQRRHEYDHYLGYDAEHHEDVEAVCSKCHHCRESARVGGTEDSERVA